MKSESIEKRLARIESRIVQLMLHIGVDPYTKTYDKLLDDKYDTDTKLNTQGRSKAKGRKQP
jgi:hypothetical protein